VKSRKVQSTSNDSFPDADELAALRGWHSGLPARQAVGHYLGNTRASGQSSRAMISDVRRRLSRIARSRHRPELVQLFELPAAQRVENARAVATAIETLRRLPLPQPLVTDEVARWLPTRAAAALRGQGIRTLADLTVRIPRRRRWYASISGLGAQSARSIEALFAAHPHLTEQARALVVTRPSIVQPWEQLVVPTDLDGSRGAYRAPRASCVLAADDDYRAVQAWLELQEVATTQRAYRKEAERLMLWAILERGKALSSLTTEDAIAYRAFLRRPTPRERWVGPARSRLSNEWRPFHGALAARSVAYALSVIGALYRWLIEQRYVLANPFAGIKVKGAGRTQSLDTSRGFTLSEWQMVRPLADDIEWTFGWSAEAAQRLRFVLDFWHGTGLRPSEMVHARLGQLRRDDHGDDWLHVIGKGSKEGDVAVPLSALGALERNLAERGLPTTRSRWSPATPLIPSLGGEGGLTSSRLWAIMRRFFRQAADVLATASPATAERLQRASPHWMRHTHASHALSAGVELKTVRDNLRHASIATTSVYVHTDQVERAQQMREAFPVHTSA
jgi:site-specific recombinase XerD